MDKVIELNEMPNSYFTKCIIKRNEQNEYGMVKLTKQNQIMFTSKESNTIRELTADEINNLYTKKGKKFNRNKILEGKPVAVKIVTKKESEPYGSYFIVVAEKETVTLNNRPLTPGTVVLFDGKDPTIYSNYEEFCADVQIKELPDFDTTCKELRRGVRSNTITNNSSRIDVEDSPNFMSDVFNTQPNQSNPQYEADDWEIDKAKAFANADYIITKLLYNEKDNGLLEFKGYYLQHISGDSSKDIKLSEHDTISLAKQYKIKNAKAVTKGGKTFMQGVGCALDNLEQAYWED